MSILNLHSNYYYLATSLPDLVLEEKHKALGCAAFIEEISDFIADADIRLLYFIRLPFDNANLITLLESSPRPFDPNGNYTRDELLLGIKVPALLPEHMQPLVEARRENRQLYPDLSLEDQLNWLFYEEAIEHSNKFIALWFTAELNLRNVLAAINVRNNLSHLSGRGEDYERCLSSCIICRNNAAEQILKSTASDFGLSSLLPWLEQIIDLPLNDMLHRERVIDQVRWDMLDELTTFTYFTIEAILACSIKLTLVERWIKLDPATGRQKLEQLAAEIQKGFS